MCFFLFCFFSTHSLPRPNGYSRRLAPITILPSNVHFSARSAQDGLTLCSVDEANATTRNDSANEQTNKQTRE